VVVAPILSAYLVLVGLMLGSFINLAADRLPRRESLITPRSHCRSCGRELNVVDLLPVAGYVVRAGRCAGCGAAIGASSPVVEAACGVVMLAPLALLGPWPGALVGFAAVSLVGVAAVGFAFKSSSGRKPTSGRDIPITFTGAADTGEGPAG
jgi:prepilin signal peptidase PulO-like enzyme (type II secretory pathway)